MLKRTKGIRSKRKPAKGLETKGMEALVRAHADVLELSEYQVDDEELEKVEDVLGHPLPADLRSLLRLGDGGVLMLQHAVVHLAGAEQLSAWVAAGVHDELDAIPFAHDASGTVFVIDERGDWGGPVGAVYRVRSAKRVHGRLAVRDAVRLADNLSEFIRHVGAGRDAF